MKLASVLVLGIVGPIVALIVTWQPAVAIANISAGKAPGPHIVSELRANPDDSLLRELAEIAVSYPRFGGLKPEEVLRRADEMLAGNHVFDGIDAFTGVPFEPDPYYFGRSTAHLGLHMFAIPSLLGRAYDVSGESAYIQAAVQYILAWAKYESSLIVPRGYFFNDHAIASRSIVVTEIWRLYRSSEVFEIGEAASLLHYAQKLAALLLDERLYEYRTNHGFMQCLSLMHLATAFPLLTDAEHAFKTAWERLDAQLELFVNAEGVILEHSSSYHLNGLNRLAAAWRYAGLNEVAVPGDMVKRYAKALEFNAALKRPDGTLPLIGDTGDYEHSAHQVAEFDSDGVVSDVLHDADASDIAPDPVTMAAGAGYVILWGGLQHWPDPEGLAQTVFHWGNFLTRVHKHADELGVSIWARGTQWVRGIGYWPFVPSRRDAVGWRSSNGPHWLGEEADADRASALEAHATGDELSFFDVVRENADGRQVRRQLVKLGTGAWAIVDSFSSNKAESAETVWRFSPDLALRSLSPGRFEVLAADAKLSIFAVSAGNLTIDADEVGDAEWNSGLVSGREVLPSPAIRLQTDDDHLPVVTVFSLDSVSGARESVESVDLRWNDPADWSVELTDSGKTAVVIERLANRVVVKETNTAPAYLRLSTGIPESAGAAIDQALDAYERIAQRYGNPFHPALERRTKVTGAILLAALLQITAFAVVARRFRRWWPAVLVSSSLAWLGLSSFLGLHFLV